MSYQKTILDALVRYQRGAMQLGLLLDEQEEAERRVAHARHTLKHNEAALIASGEVEGKNEATREANLAILTGAERGELLDAEDELRAVKTRVAKVELAMRADKLEHDTYAHLADLGILALDALRADHDATLERAAERGE